VDVDFVHCIWKLLQSFGHTALKQITCGFPYVLLSLCESVNGIGSCFLLVLLLSLRDSFLMTNLIAKAQDEVCEVSSHHHATV